MKNNNLIIRLLGMLMFSFVLSLFSACENGQEETEHPVLDIENNEYAGISADGDNIEIRVVSNDEWKSVSDSEWCNIKEGLTGNGNGLIKISVSPNQSSEVRIAKVKVSNYDESVTVYIMIEQLAAESRFVLPIVFHVLYNDPTNEIQYVRQGHLQTIIEGVNKIYDNSGLDFEIDFVMAEKDPNGTPLDEPGVNRVKWDESSMDCATFMGSTDNKYLDLVWNPYKYVNIMLYSFAADADTGEEILGISQLPYLISPDNLPGVTQLNLPGYPSESSLRYPYCVSINNKYIYDTAGALTPEFKEGSVTYIVGTIAHELGHYLGLRHAYSEASGVCKDTDFCKDTPTYDRIKYAELQNIYGDKYKEYLDELIWRDDCLTGERFKSTNIMDYSISYMNSFTKDQAYRMRYILERAAYMPTLNRQKTISKSNIHDKEIDIPVSIME